MTANKRYLDAFESCGDAVFLETLGGRIRDFNAAALALYGYSAEEMLKLSVFDLVPQEIRKTIPDVIVGEIQVGHVEVDAIGVRKSGERFATRVLIQRVPVEGEEMALVTVLLRDAPDPTRP